MKKMLIIFTTICFVFVAVSAFAGRVRVKGYFRSNGTYVQPHYRTAPNKIRTDNYSYPGNLNPNTQKFTPYSNSPGQTWPRNPNPYRNQQTYSPFNKSNLHNTWIAPNQNKYKLWD